jgi:hypothetical protein
MASGLLAAPPKNIEWRGKGLRQAIRALEKAPKSSEEKADLVMIRPENCTHRRQIELDIAVLANAKKTPGQRPA